MAATASSLPPVSPAPVASPVMRVPSIDAFRGFVMFLMLAEAMRLWTLHDAFPSSGFWAIVAYNTTHVPWQGCSLHDLIQPAFSFLAGASLPFSIASRQAKGETFGRMLGHALRRSVILILLGIFLRSMGRPQTYWTFEDTLTQIGLGYTLLFLLAFASLPRPGGRLRRDPRRLLGGVRALPAAARDLRLRGGGRAGRLAAPLHGLPRALQHELEPVVGVRHLVPEPLPARVAVPLQRRRLVDAELHPDPRHDDARHVGGRVAQEPADDGGEAEGARRLGRRAHPRRPRPPVAARLPDREAHLDVVLHALQRRPDPPHPRRASTRRSRCRGWKRWSFPLMVIGANSIAIYVMSWTMEHFVSESLEHPPRDARRFSCSGRRSSRCSAASPSCSSSGGSSTGCTGRRSSSRSDARPARSTGRPAVSEGPGLRARAVRSPFLICSEPLQRRSAFCG